ncbi:hypothetical protein JHK87_018478 [Glycine soja]|nr:hypothetical protein JHK87_018478 [Glycine soja]
MSSQSSIASSHQDIPKAKSHEINPRGIEIAEVDFVSPNKVQHTHVDVDPQTRNQLVWDKQVL